MKTSIKRVLCLVFAVVLVCALAACSGGKTESSASNGSDSKKQESEVVVSQRFDDWENFDPYATISDDIKGSTVRFATWIDHTQTEGNGPLSKFEEDTGLKWELVTVAQGEYVEKLKTMFASGDRPDVFVTNEDLGNFPLTIEIAQPINKCSTVNLEEPIWDQSMLATGTIDGNIYLVNTLNSPWSGSNLVYYNKELFENNGFKTPAEYYEEGNWTWATLEKILKDVKSLGPDYQGGSIDVEIIADSAGASFCKYDYKTATFSNGTTDPNLVAAYQWYAGVRDQGLTNGSFASFKEGKTGIIITGVYGLKSNGYWIGMDPESVGFTYLPALQDGGKGKVSSIYRMYGIIAGAKNADAAGYFLRHFLDYRNYDLNNTFLTPEAGTFYYELTNTVADEKYFNFDDAMCSFVGESSSDVFNRAAMKAASAQVNGEIQAVSNVVDQAVKSANDIVAKVKETYK